MPREITMLSDEPFTVTHLLVAAVKIDGSLVPRTLFDGWVTQLVDHDDRAVVSVELSRLIADSTDLERITGMEVPVVPVWLTEATAPWGPAGETGVAVARVLAELLHARFSVAEGW